MIPVPRKITRVRVVNMNAWWSRFRSGTLKTILAGILYIVTLPAVRNWLMNLLVGKRKNTQKVIDVEAKGKE
jgi:uncharacterized membrane protein HdeD (DUF308 family)